MDTEEIQQLLKTGIEAAQSGNKIIAHHILMQVVSKDPNNEMGWMWLASVAETNEERRENLLKVLSINPSNERARQALSKLPRPTPTDEIGGASEAPCGTSHTRPDDLHRPHTTVRPTIGQFTALCGEAPDTAAAFVLPMFIMLAVLGVGMIGLGLALLWSNNQSDEDKTPTATQAAAVAAHRPDVPTRHARPISHAAPTRNDGADLDAVQYTAAYRDRLRPLKHRRPSSSYTLLTSAQRGGQTTWALYTLLANGTDERRIPAESRGDCQ